MVLSLSDRYFWGQYHSVVNKVHIEPSKMPRMSCHDKKQNLFKISITDCDRERAISLSVKFPVVPHSRWKHYHFHSDFMKMYRPAYHFPYPEFLFADQLLSMPCFPACMTPPKGALSLRSTHSFFFCNAAALKQPSREFWASMKIQNMILGPPQLHPRFEWLDFHQTCDTKRRGW